MTVPILITLWSIQPVKAQSSIEIYSGYNNQVIGVISQDKYDDLNICNDYGSGGSSYSSNGIFSTTGINGSSNSAWGAYNNYTTTPPYLYFNGGKIYISSNSYFANSIHPDVLKGRICK
ncbi:MAG TPA: hypothetical protein V6C58_12465 [Allocoleopsis sp.]